MGIELIAKSFGRGKVQACRGSSLCRLNIDCWFGVGDHGRWILSMIPYLLHDDQNGGRSCEIVCSCVGSLFIVNRRMRLRVFPEA